MSGQNYIGSKISLISLSDIRYVGILQNISSIESTVALQNVKSYGTEGRKGNLNEEIPASDNVFDYVVFRGSDIKDLQVFEAPPSFQSEYSNSTLQQQHEQQQQCDTMINIANYPESYYTTQPTYSTVNYHHAPYNNVINQSNGYWQSNTTGPTPGSAFSNRAHQQQQLSYQHQHQHLQKSRFQMPVPENYQVPSLSNGLSTVEPASFSSADPTLLGNYDLLNEASPKKQDEDQDKTVAPVFSEKEAVVTAAPVVSKTAMQLSTSQEKEEVTAIGQVDDVLVDSLVKQVSDLDIKQFAPVVKEVPKTSISTDNKEKPVVKKQRDSSRQKTVKEGPSSGGRKSNGRQHSTPRASATDGNSSKNRFKNVGQTDAKRSHEGGGKRNSIHINRDISSQGNHSVRGAPTNSHPHNRGIAVPKADFDFASSNAKFDKNIITEDESLGKENETVIIPETTHFYDKTKSFFDDISCESKEYKKRNRTGTYKEELKLNLETFGQTNTANQNGKRHRYRSGRGRGRPQQRGGRNKAIFNQVTQDAN